MRLRLRPWLRRVLTRGLAIVPVIVVVALYGEQGTGRLLLLSQVILSMQLLFAVIPLLRCVADRKVMGALVAPRWLMVVAWLIAGVIVVLNVKLLGDYAVHLMVGVSN